MTNVATLRRVKSALKTRSSLRSNQFLVFRVPRVRDGNTSGHLVLDFVRVYLFRVVGKNSRNAYGKCGFNWPGGFGGKPYACVATEVVVVACENRTCTWRENEVVRGIGTAASLPVDQPEPV